MYEERWRIKQIGYNGACGFRKASMIDHLYISDGWANRNDAHMPKAG